MLRTIFHHVSDFEFIILKYLLTLYHLVSWYHDILCSSLKPAVFIILSDFESPGNCRLTNYPCLHIIFQYGEQLKCRHEFLCNVPEKWSFIYPFLPMSFSWQLIHKILRTFTEWSCPKFLNVDIWLLNTWIKFILGENWLMMIVYDNGKLLMLLPT